MTTNKPIGTAAHDVDAVLERLEGWGAPKKDNARRLMKEAASLIRQLRDDIERKAEEDDRISAQIHEQTKKLRHPDDLAVDAFATAMKAKLAKKRAEGRGGWEDKEQCSAEYLSRLLREHVEKGDPLDVGNLAMMLHQRGDRIADEREQYSETRKKIQHRAPALPNCKGGGATRAMAKRAALAAQARERMCVNCGRTRPAIEGRETPHKDCPSPDACTWDHTPEEAWQYWRKKYHDLRASPAQEAGAEPWRYEIQYGPEGEANYAWVYDGTGTMVCTAKTHHAIDIVSRVNSPALAAERRGRARAYEEMARLHEEDAQEYNRLRDPGMANHQRKYAKLFRDKAAMLASSPSPEGDHG